LRYTRGVERIGRAGAIYLFTAPIVKRGLPSASGVFGFSAAATQTAIALLPVPTATPTPPPPTPVPTPEFTPYWVQNTRRTRMWSGPAGPPGVISFGMTSGQGCYFEVSGPLARSRLFVKNPYDMNYFWIDAEAVMPAPQPPEHEPGPKPKDQNCTDVIYDE
jgi:hypothetical protein